MNLFFTLTKISWMFFNCKLSGVQLFQNLIFQIRLSFHNQWQKNIFRKKIHLEKHWNWTTRKIMWWKPCLKMPPKTLITIFKSLLMQQMNPISSLTNGGKWMLILMLFLIKKQIRKHLKKNLWNLRLLTWSPGKTWWNLEFSHSWIFIWGIQRNLTWRKLPTSLFYWW